MTHAQYVFRDVESDVGTSQSTSSPHNQKVPNGGARVYEMLVRFSGEK